MSNKQVGSLKSYLKRLKQQSKRGRIKYIYIYIIRINSRRMQDKNRCNCGVIKPRIT